MSFEGLVPAGREMVQAAFARPDLRRLFPYLSLDTRLKFRATAEYPYSVGYPYLHYVDPDCVLDGPAFELRDGEQRPIRRGNLGALISELISLLPPPP